MGLPSAAWNNIQLNLGRGRRRFHVLAQWQTPFWLVSGTGLRLQLHGRPSAVYWYERRSFDRYQTATSLMLPVFSIPAYRYRSEVPMRRMTAGLATVSKRPRIKTRLRTLLQ